MLVSRTLKEYEDILTEYDFIRAHESRLVNKEKEEVLKELSNFNR